MLGPHLKRLRGDDVSQTMLGEMIGCKQANVSSIERGESSISAAMLARWLDATNATEPDRLEALRLAGEPEPETAPLA